MCSSILRNKNLNEVQFFLLGWTEQKNVKFSLENFILRSSCIRAKQDYVYLSIPTGSLLGILLFFLVLGFLHLCVLMT